MTHTVLFVAANPFDTQRLALDEECRAIEHRLAGSELKFHSKWAVSVDDLMLYLNELSPTVLHFSGHGSRGSSRSPGDGAVHRDVPSEEERAGIFLQDRDRSQYVSERALAKMIASASPSTRLVVLNACYSAGAAESLRQVVECVIGIDGSIHDDAARSFGAAFYRALAFRHSVRVAVDQAAATLDALRYPDHLPRCLTRDGHDADQIFLLDPAPRAAVAAPRDGELFLAHPPASKASAAALHDRLQPDVGVFLAARSLQASELWDDELLAAQRAARVIALVISRQADPAWYLSPEILAALSLHRASPRLVVVRLEPGLRVPQILDDVPAIDATPGGGLDSVVDPLRDHVRRLRSHPLPASSASAPRARSDAFRLYDRLGRLTEPVFDQIAAHAGLERATLAPATAPLAERALDVALRAAVDPALHRRIHTALEQRAPWTRG